MYYITLFCTTFVIISIFYSLFILISKYIFHDKIENFSLKITVSLSFIILFSLLIYGLVVVDNMIDNSTKISDGTVDYSGALGDLIGGVLNPILALFGILAGGLAFYTQYQANKQVQDQFKIQQFESQFYEMLRLHKENVNEIEIEVLNFEYKGPDGLGGIGLFDPKKVKVKGRDVFIYFANELEIAFNIYKEYLFKENIEEFDFSIPYKAFFNGMNEINYLTFKGYLLVSAATFEATYLVHFKNDFFFNTQIKAKYNLFQGHENMLGHYYRHLFHTVKFIVEQDIKFISYSEKRKYLRLLRAQLSNYEQAMLFYNYLAYAPEWENGNNFFSDYRMIHNLYDNVLIDDRYFIKELNLLKRKQNVALSYKDNDHIFESQKWDA